MNLPQEYSDFHITCKGGKIIYFNKHLASTCSLFKAKMDFQKSINKDNKIITFNSNARYEVMVDFINILFFGKKIKDFERMGFSYLFELSQLIHEFDEKTLLSEIDKTLSNLIREKKIDSSFAYQIVNLNLNTTGKQIAKHLPKNLTGFPLEIVSLSEEGDDLIRWIKDNPEGNHEKLMKSFISHTTTSISCKNFCNILKAILSSNIEDKLEIITELANIKRK